MLTLILVPPVKSTAKLKCVTNEYVRPPIIINSTTGKIILLDFIKSIFLNGILISLLGIIFFLERPINRFILSSKNPVFANNIIIVFDKNTSTIIVNNIFIINIVANPLTLDCPRINNIIATIIVVILASNILDNDSLLPNVTASFNFFPIFNWSFILSKLITDASTAIPIPRSIAAIPGNVSVPSIK